MLKTSDDYYANSKKFSGNSNGEFQMKKPDLVSVPNIRKNSKYFSN